jgi:hypothetical protein
MLGLSKTKPSRSRQSRSGRKSRTRFVTLNSGLNANDLKEYDPFIFYKNRHYLKEIESKGFGIGKQLAPNFFYNYIKKYIDAYKNLSNPQINLEFRRKEVNLARKHISLIDNKYANNKLLNEQPILSLILHGGYHGKKDFKLDWLSHLSRERYKPFVSTPLDVDVILISNAALGDLEFSMSSAEQKEFNKIILNLKYGSFLNKTLQQKQFDTVTQQLRDFQKVMFEKRIIEANEFIESKQKDVDMFIRLKNIKRAKEKNDSYMFPEELEESNRKREEEIQTKKEHLKDFHKFLTNIRNKFQIYHLKKGKKINKYLTKDPGTPQGIFELENNENLYDIYIENGKQKDIIRAKPPGTKLEKTYISLDKFVNYYYETFNDKPNSIIVIDHSCTQFTSHHSNPKEPLNKMKQPILNTQSRERRSFNNPPRINSKKYKSLSINKSKKNMYFKRSIPLTNKEIIEVQNKTKKNMNYLEIQKELNKMKVKSRSTRSSRSRSPIDFAYPHEDVYEQLKHSLSKKSKSRTSRS